MKHRKLYYPLQEPFLLFPLFMYTTNNTLYSTVLLRYAGFPYIRWNDYARKQLVKASKLCNVLSALYFAFSGRGIQDSSCQSSAVSNKFLFHNIYNLKFKLIQAYICLVNHIFIVFAIYEDYVWNLFQKSVLR